MPDIDFANIEELTSYVNQFFIENHNNEINGIELNNAGNGWIKFIIQAPRNWNRAKVVGTAGNYTATSEQCILVFKQAATGSVTLTDNVYNEWVIQNQTSTAKQLVGAISQFVTPAGIISNYCPAQSTINIAKGDDNKWYQILSGTTTNTLLPPLIGVAGGSGDNDPVVTTSIYQNDAIIGLGSTNDGKIEAVIQQQIWDNYSDSGNLFDYDPDTGTIQFDPDTFQWYDGMSITINLNQ